MKKTTLYITPPGAVNKKDLLFEEMVSLCPDSNDYSGVLYLGPNSHVIAAAKNRFFSYIRKHGERSAYIPFRSMTIKQLALGLHEAYGEGSVISDRVRVLIFCGLLRDKNIGYAKLLAGLFKRTRHYAPDRSLPELREEIRGLIFEERARDRAVRAWNCLRCMKMN